MKLTQMKPLNRVSGIAMYKQRLVHFMQHLRYIDLKNYARWPLWGKSLCWVLLFIVVLVLGYSVLISPKITANQQAIVQQQKLFGEYKTKHQQLLAAKRQQQHMQQLSVHLEQQLQHLPKQEQIPALLSTMHQLGQKSGLTVQNLQLETPLQHGFLLEQPILIEAQGDYHAFGQFVSELAQLTQLVTLHDFSIEANVTQRTTTARPLLYYRLQAKTYHYVSSFAQASVGSQIK